VVDVVHRVRGGELVQDLGRIAFKRVSERQCAHSGANDLYGESRHHANTALRGVAAKLSDLKPVVTICLREGILTKIERRSHGCCLEEHERIVSTARINFEHGRVEENIDRQSIRAAAVCISGRNFIDDQVDLEDAADSSLAAGLHRGNAERGVARVIGVDGQDVNYPRDRAAVICEDKTLNGEHAK